VLRARAKAQGRHPTRLRHHLEGHVHRSLPPLLRFLHMSSHEDKLIDEAASPTGSQALANEASRHCLAVINSPVVRVEPISGGFSNLVYRICFADHAPVLFRSQLQCLRDFNRSPMFLVSDFLASGGSVWSMCSMRMPCLPCSVLVE
jgi:hypothetical protein